MNIDIKGTIVASEDEMVYEWFGIECVSPKKVKAKIEAAAANNNEELTIVVNSGGGDVFAGNEIYYLIAGYPGKKIVEIAGLAASAATVVCCAGDEVKATPGAQYMIHNVSCAACGDYNEMDHTSEILKNANKSISNVYRLKTGMSEAELLNLMNRETWMDATKAKEYGFVDSIIGDTENQLTSTFKMSNSCYATVIAPEKLAELRKMINNPSEPSSQKDVLIELQQLNLLKLKGGIKHV